PVPLLGREQRQAAGAAAEVQDVAGPSGQPGPQPAGPGRARLRVAQSMVRLLVEGGGPGVPVDTVRARPVTAVCGHGPRVTPTTDIDADTQVPVAVAQPLTDALLGCPPVVLSNRFVTAATDRTGPMRN